MTSTFNPSWSYTKWSTNPAPHLQRKRWTGAARTLVEELATLSTGWCRVTNCQKWLRQELIARKTIVSFLCFVHLNSTHRTSFLNIASKLLTKSLPVVLSSGLFFRAHVIHIRQHNRCWMSAVKHWKKTTSSWDIEVAKIMPMYWLSIMHIIYIYTYILYIYNFCVVRYHGPSQ